MASGSRNSAGYSFAAAPSPMSTPASHATRRCQASRAAIANATANRSQLVYAWTNSTGDSATIAASHGLRPDRWYTAQVMTSADSASISAVTSKYDSTWLTFGASPLSATVSYQPDNVRAAYMNQPVSTGYSTGCWAYGTLSRSNSSA